MNNIQHPDANTNVRQQAFNRLPVALRASAAGHKYAAAVELYASTGMPLHDIAKMCDVTPGGLCAHIGGYHRELLFARYGIDPSAHDTDFCVRKPKGQSYGAHIKYKEAIEACGDLAYIEYNVSQIAHMFELDGPALASQLRVHYPEIIPTREELRSRLGIADNTPRGPRRTTAESYREAMEMYRRTDMTLGDVAHKCDVSKSGLCQFMRFYHKDILETKAGRRASVAGQSDARRRGQLSGNGRLCGPKAETVALYAQALELYRTTGMTLNQIANQTGVPVGGFRGYLRQWHPDEVHSRRSSSRALTDKYAAAVASLSDNPRDVSEVAAEFGLNANTFRTYLRRHEPALAERHGMVRLADGKSVKRSSAEKYRAAIDEYATTAEPLKSIAQRHGLIYNSVLGYVTRNCPEARASHMRAVAEAREAI